MGGPGSGATERSLAWDLHELCQELLARIERASWDQKALADRPWLAERRARLERIQDQLKQKAIRERVLGGERKR